MSVQPSTWTLQSGTYYQKVAMDETGQFRVAIVYQSGNNTVVYSRDFGVTWTASTGITGDATTISMNPYGNIVMVGAVNISSSPVYISTDFGATFTPTNPLSGFWTFVGVEYNNYMIACDYAGDVATVYLSQNQGDGWTSIASYNGYYITNVAWSYDDGMEKIYTLGYNTSSPYVTSLNVTTNRGVSWTTLTSISSYNLSGVACDLTGQYVVVSAYQDGVYRSVDYGVTWMKTSAPSSAPDGPSMGYIVCDHTGNHIVTIDNVDYKVYASSDAGQTWVLQTTTGSNGAGDVLGVSMSPDGSYRYASFINVGTYSLVVPAYKTVNFSNGAYNPLSFITCSNTAEHIVAVGNTIYGNDKCIVYSDDNGLNWNLSDADSSGDSLYTCLAASPSGQYVVAGFQNGVGGVIYSNDYGVTFTNVTTGFNVIPSAIAISNDGTRFYATSHDGSGAIYLGSENGSVVVKNIGVSGMYWKSIACDSAGLRVYATAQDDYSPYYLYQSEFAEPHVHVPFNNSTVDVMGNSTITPHGSLSYVSGVVSPYAVNMANSPGGGASSYITGTWADTAAFTMSFWFNAQSLGAQQILVGAYNGQFQLLLLGNNQLAFYVPVGGGDVIISYTPGITINTWYQWTVVFQKSGLCSMYINGSLVGTYNNTSSFTSTSSGIFTIGCEDDTRTQAFNGYISDFHLYNTAGSYGIWNQIPSFVSSSILPLAVACDSTGDVVTVTTGTDGVYQSVNGGSTWDFKRSLTQSSVSVSPQLSGLSSNSWSKYGIDWTSSASTHQNGQDPFVPFIGGSITNSWNTTNGSYSPSGNNSGIYTTFYTNGFSTQTVQGDWLQIKSSSRLVMESYQLGCGNSNNLSSVFYVIGSNDGVTWHALQYAQTSGRPTYGVYEVIPGTILVNSTSSQTWGSTTLSTTSYDGSANSYTYFRLIVTNSYYGPGTIAQLGKWIINAVPDTLMTVQAQRSGLVSNSWFNDGVAWTASVSSYNAGWAAYKAFNTTIGDAWLSSNSPSPYNDNGTVITGVAGSTTVLGGIGVLRGEWLQIQSSAPKVLSSFSFGLGPNPWPYTCAPATYYIVGSTDGSSWYPIQSGIFSISNFTSASTTITINYTGTQTLSGGMPGTVVTTAYASSTNAYTYFRLIGTSIMNYAGSGSTYMEIGEWYMNFSPSSLATIVPQLTGLGSESWSSSGVNWNATASSALVSAGYYGIYYAFNNAIEGGDSAGWACGSSNYNGSYNGSVSTTVLGVGAVSGEWLQLQSSVPVVMQSYLLQELNVANLVMSYLIVGSMDGAAWYPIQRATYQSSPYTDNHQGSLSRLLADYSGTQTVVSATSANVSTTSYPTSSNPYLYFRVIGTSLFPGANYFETSEWNIDFLPFVTSGGLVSPYIDLPLKDSVVDVKGHSTVTAHGSISYLSGEIGTYTAVLSNTAGSTPNNYIIGTMPTFTDFTISGRFTVVTIPGPGSVSSIVNLGTDSSTFVAITYFNDIEINSIVYNGLVFSFINSSGTRIIVGYLPNISLGAWYNFTFAFSLSGTCYAYVNNTMLGSAPGQTLYANMTRFAIGSACHVVVQGYNGLIHDLRIYDTALPLPTGRSILNVANDSTGSNLVVVDDSSNTVFRSTDSGANWEAQIVNDTNGNDIRSLSIDSTGTYVFASYYNADAFMSQRSSGLTTSWTVTNGIYYPVMTFSNDNVYQTAITSLYGFTETGHSVISYSTDSGATWTQGPDMNGFVTDLVADSTGQYVVAVLEMDLSASPSVYRSTDYGATFTELSNSPDYQNTGINCIACNSTGQRLYAGAYDGHIYVSTNAGVDWASRVMPDAVFNIICSHSGQHVYANVNNQLCISTDYGQTWSSQIVISLNGCSEIACDWTGQYVVAACYNDGVYRSTNYGQTWTKTSAPSNPNVGGSQNYYYIACNSTGNRIISFDINNATVYISLDAGATWVLQYTPDSRSNEAFMGVSLSPDGTRYAASPWAPGSYFLTAGSPDIPNAIPCFLEGTQILCQIAGVETYVNVEAIRPGTLVKTSRDGYKAVKLIGHRDMTNPGTADRNKNSLYLCTKEAYPEITADVTITGCHAILVNQISEEQRAGIISTLQRVFVTDKKYRLPACVDERAAVVQTAGTFTVWHFALDHYDTRMNYGVYAQGLLVESSPICHMNSKNYTLEVL